MNIQPSNVVAFPAAKMGAREPWSTRHELAAHLRVSLSTVDNLTRDMPDDPSVTLKMGKFRRYKISGVERWLQMRGAA